jgi:hypothetical protein
VNIQGNSGEGSEEKKSCRESLRVFSDYPSDRGENDG